MFAFGYLLMLIAERHAMSAHPHTDGRETYSDLSRREVKELHKAEIVASNQGGTGLGQGCAIHVGLKELSNSGGACIWNDKVRRIQTLSEPLGQIPITSLPSTLVHDDQCS